MLNTKMTMAEAIHCVAADYPDREALVCGETRLTYRQLLEHIQRLAGGLSHLGIGRGDKVAALLPPGPEFVYLFFAVATLGAVVVPLDPQLRRRGLSDVLRDAEPLALVSFHPVEDQVLQEAASLRHVIPTEGAGPGPSMSEIMAAGASTSIPPADISPDDLLALLYTSGTTGRPKGAMHTHRSLIAPVVASLKMAAKMAKALARYGTRLLRVAGQPQTFLSTTGWHTITGIEIMFQGLLLGDRLVVMPRFHPSEALRLVEQERVTILVAVPMAYQVMLKLPDLDRYDTSSLLVAGTGAAPCPPHLAREIRERFRCAIHIGFGATETAGGIAVSSLSDSDARQNETVGQPLPGMEIRILDEQRRELPAGQVGELVVRSEGVMLGYYRDSEKTSEVIDEESWYYTGDLAKIDEAGYLHIVGRKKDMIIRGGQNIYPAEIENYLTAHPKIRETAVVGVPAAVGGESVWAFVILEDGVEMTAQEVLDYCRAELEPYKIPSRVRFLEEFPRSGTDKPQKFRLRAAALREIEGEEVPD